MMDKIKEYLDNKIRDNKTIKAESGYNTWGYRMARERIAICEEIQKELEELKNEKNGV